jgi:hypothetical protein
MEEPPAGVEGGDRFLLERIGAVHLVIYGQE